MRDLDSNVLPENSARLAHVALMPIYATCVGEYPFSCVWRYLLAAVTLKNGKI